MKDKHHKESKNSLRKRKLLSSWDDVKDNSKKRLKRDESTSSKGILLHSEKSRDGLISARKLVEKSLKDLRNRKSSEFKRSSKDHSVSVIEGDLPGESSVKVISKLQQSSDHTSKQRSKSEKVKDNKENIYHSESDPSFKGLIESHTGNPREKSSQERVCSTSESSCSKVGQSTSETNDRRTEKYPCRERVERSRSEKERERKYTEKKQLDKSGRPSQEVHELERKEKYNRKSCVAVSKIDGRQSKRHSERDSQKNSEALTDFTLQGHTDTKAKYTDLRYKLQRKNKHGSKYHKHDTLPEKEMKEGHIEQHNSKRFKPDRIKSNEKEECVSFSLRNSLSPKQDKSQVEGESDNISNSNTSIEGVWSDFITENSKHYQEPCSNSDFQNISKGKECETENCNADDLLLGLLWKEKRPLTPKRKCEKKPVTPKQSYVQSGRAEVSAVTCLEEAMVRVNEEKISKYAKASNKEKGALSNIGSDSSKMDDFKEHERDVTSSLLSKVSQGEIEAAKKLKMCPKNKHSRSHQYPNLDLCSAEDNNPFNVFIEELISIDHRNENLNAKYNEVSATTDNIIDPLHVTKDGIKDCEHSKVKIPDAQDNSVSCFDIRIHVSEKEMNDLLGCESNMSDRITTAQLSKKQSETRKNQKEVSSRTKSQICNIKSSNKKNEKKSNDAERKHSKGMKQENEAPKSNPVLKLPLDTKQVFSESIVFKETKKLKSLSEKVYVSVKGTKIVLKSEALRSEDKKPCPKNSLSKKEYDADREFLNQLKTKYSKEQLKNCQKQKSEMKDCQASLIKDDEKTKESPEKHSTCTVEKSEHQDDCKEDKTLQRFASEDQELLQDTNSFCDNSEIEIKNTSYHSDNIGNSTDKTNDEGTNNEDDDQQKGIDWKVKIKEAGVERGARDHMTDLILEQNETSANGNDFNCISQQECNSSEKSFLMKSGSGGQMLEEPMEIGARATQPLQLASQCSSVSIDFIRNSIMKKIEEKEKVPGNSDDMDLFFVNDQTNFELADPINEKIHFPVKDVSKFKTCLSSKPTQEEQVQSPTKLTSPIDGDRKGKVCRELHTETESITEFFDEKSQLDIRNTISLRAKDGISVRKQSFDKVSEVDETDENVCSVVESGMEVEGIEVSDRESDFKATLQNSESEEGEVHSSDSESDYRENGNKKPRRKSSRDSHCQSEKESSKRKNHSSKHRSNSSSKTKERRDKEVDRLPKKSSETEKSSKPKMSRRDTERKHEVKEDKRDRDYLSREKSPVQSSSRENRTVERRKVGDSKQIISHRHSSSNRGSEERDRHSRSRHNSSERYGRSHHDNKDAKIDKHSRIRRDNLDRKTDRHTSTHHDSTESKSVHKDSNRPPRDTRRKSFTRN